MEKLKTPQFILAVLYSVALFGVIGYVLVEGLPNAAQEGPARDITVMLVTGLIAFLKSQLHFFDGSSQGSKDKDRKSD